jgi:mitochondrial import inner membrane translocase subunit TIM50
MFPILARSIPRRTLIRSVRCLSQKPPVLPAKPPLPDSNNQAKPLPKPETSEKPADSTPINKPVDPKPMSSVPTLDFSPPEPSEEGQKTGAMSSKGYKTASERTRRSRIRISLAVLFLAFGAYAVYTGREWEEEELKMKKMVC